MQETTTEREIRYEQPLTPREYRLERAAFGLRVGAFVYGGLALALLLGGIIAALSRAEGFFATVQALLLAGYTGADDFAFITALMLALVSASALLVLMVGVLAQELWSLILGMGLLAGWGVALLVYGYLPALVGLGALGFALATIWQDVRALRLNPVMLKELRERMRGARSFAVISVYLGLMSAFAVLLFLINAPINLGLTTSVSGDLGRAMFNGIVGLQLLLIIFIAPAFTSGAVTGERERKTYDLLQITLLPRPSFIIGKLESALGYIFLLLLAAIPLQGIAFLFGGVTEIELALAFVILVVTAITLGTVGLFFSTLVERTLTASVRAYTLALAILIGVPALGGFALNPFNSAITGLGTGLRNVSPVVEAGLVYLGAFLTSLNPLATALASQELFFNQRTIGFWSVTLSSTGETIPLASPWISFTILYLVASAVLIVLAVRRIRRLEA